MADPEKAMDVVDDNDNEDDGEWEDENGTNDSPQSNNAVSLSSQLLKDPNVIAAVQGNLNSIIGTPSTYIQSLPAPVKRRLKALKKIQLESTIIEARFYEEVHKLECKYQKLYVPLFDKRASITKGDYEPNDDECDWPSEDEDEDDEDGEEKEKDKDKKEKINEEKKVENAEDVKGIPEFWLTIFKNVDILQEMVQERDEPALTHLTDITVTFQESQPMGFTLHFHFSPNDYFTNQILTKEYIMKCEPSESDPFSFEGPEIYKCKGCTIDWKKGKNLTMKTVKKKQKHAQKGSIRSLTKTVKCDSFFNFFDPPAIPESPDAEISPDIQELVSADFEIGHYIRERIIPKAVLFFTGEALEDEDYDDDSDDDDSEDGEEDEDDPDYDPSKGPKGKDAADCKQQ